MAKALVENQVCAACGADIRPDALFCYGCGSAVAAETTADVKDAKRIGGKTFVTEANENGSGKTTKLNESKIENITERPISTPVPAKDAELKSAAAMRRKSKVYQPTKTEIIWEERENAPNGWFIITAIVLTLLAAGIFYLAIYLK